MSSPKISIIFLTYNQASLLPHTINSVLNQIFKDFELIIVDGCLIDSTKKIVEEFQKKDKRIRYIRLDKNSGALAHPKNVGIQNSKGKFIAFLDHDSEWLPKIRGPYFKWRVTFKIIFQTRLKIHKQSERMLKIINYPRIIKYDSCTKMSYFYMYHNNLLGSIEEK